MTTGFSDGYPATRTWRCDTCGGPVTVENGYMVSTVPNHVPIFGGPVTVENGYMVWDSRDPHRDFRIIHKSQCDDKSLNSSMALSDLVGVDGIASLLSLLTAGPLAFVSEGGSADKHVSLTDFADLFRRLHVPNYERARQHFDDPRVREFVGGWNERAMYMPSELAKIAAVGEAPEND